AQYRLQCYDECITTKTRVIFSASSEPVWALTNCSEAITIEPKDLEKIALSDWRKTTYKKTDYPALGRCPISILPDKRVVVPSLSGNEKLIKLYLANKFQDKVKLLYSKKKGFYYLENTTNELIETTVSYLAKVPQEESKSSCSSDQFLELLKEFNS